MWIWLSALAVLRVTSQFSLSKRQAGARYSWSVWGPCSRSCGSGVEVRSRSCRSLRPGGVTDCLGPARMHRTCNAEDCPAGSRDFREVQCSKYDEHDFGGRYYKWTPFYGAPNTCELNCQPKGENFYFTQAATVIDGTPCEPDKPDICIEGVCRELGCDGQLESGRLRDTCGVCDGDDSACFPVHGAFTDLHLPNGYNHVLVIPNGATNIQVSEMTPSKNFLAVKSLHGEYYFNGGSTVDYGRVLPGAGTMLRYERGSDDGGVLTPEMVTSTGPTTEPLVIELLTHEMNRGIKYEYYLPLDRKIVKSGVTWSFGSWSECSAECDEGFQTRHVYCTEGNGMRPNVYCSNERKPTANRTCNIEQCPAILRLGFRYKPELRQKNSRMQNDYRWREGPWEACSVTCGEGHQARPIYCLAHSAGPAGRNSAQAPDQECKTRGLRRPENHRPCQAGPCTEWIVGEWQPCSAECGPGEQTREVTCGKRYGCDDRTMPARIQPCNLGHCRSPEWVFGTWSQCSVECGPGEQTRDVTCGKRYGCDARTMPSRIQPCNLGPCRSPEWVFGQWSQCSAECGPGEQTREVTCGKRYGCYDRTMPDRIQPCNLGPCRSSEWVFTDWSQCSAECGPGEQTREVTCGKRYGCDDRTMPARIQPCNLGPCRSPEWVFADWSQCSAECGPGEQTREVTCGKRYGCDDRTMPDRIQPCNLGPCRSREWVFGDWSQCSAGCGPGEQTREVTCGKRYGCDNRTMPARIQPCNLGHCRSPEWVFGPWSQCSAECGPGEQTREVTCGKRYGCDDRTMPDRIQPCNLGPCRSPEWVFGDWSQCSVTCGKGTRMRSMTCQVEDTGTDRPFIVSNTECNSERMPQRIEECQGGRPCTNQIRWYIGPWGLCSVSCGGGMRKRQAICYDEEFVLQDSKLCHFQQRPRELEACNTQRCTLSQEVPSHAIPGKEAPSHTITLYEGDSHPNQPVVIPSREDCIGSRFGCCPDGITVARGPSNQGCLVPCNQTRYGCCADGMTPAKEVDRSDCPENKWSTDWRGSNQRLPSPMLVRHCQDSPYGCCPDGVSSALGYDEAGCPTVPPDKRQPGHGICNLPSDPGSCQDFAVRWFFVPESSGCNRFWYGGCDGNGNRFETKEACMMTCGSQAPKIPPFNAEANQQRQASIDVQPLPSAKPWQEVERNRRPEHRLWIERGDPTVVEGQVGQTVELRCRAKGSHGLEREWLKDGKRLQNIRYMQFPNGSLQILMMTPDDAGIFTCKVSSGDLQEFRQVSLHFPGGLMITKPPGDLEISAGKRAEFPCTVSDKNANIIWTRNGVTLESGANHSRLLVSSDGTLVVQVVQDSDEGHYTCNAYAGSAAVSASAHLKVAPPVQGSPEERWS